MWTLNNEYIEDRLTTRGCRLEEVVWRRAPLRLFASFLRRDGAWCLVVTATEAEEFELGLVTSRQCFSLQSIFLIYRNFPEQLPKKTSHSAQPTKQQSATGIE